MQPVRQCCWCDDASLNWIKPFHFASQPLSCGKSVVNEGLINKRTHGSDFMAVLHHRARKSFYQRHQMIAVFDPQEKTIHKHGIVQRGSLYFTVRRDVNAVEVLFQMRNMAEHLLLFMI